MTGADPDEAQTIASAASPGIPGYRDLRLVGEGMTSTVWRAREEGELQREVAIKVLKPGFERGEARERFEREKRVSAALGRHPHIVSVFATGTTIDGQPFMVMDLCEKGSLADYLERQGAFTVDEVLDIGEKIADAVQAAHDQGILHRDIKPQNILLSEYGPHLTDFGIARSAVATEMTGTLQFHTPAYSAPESFDVDTPPSARMDVYSLGATLFALLAGQPPYPRRERESSLQYALRVQRDPLPPFRRRDVPAELRDVIERAMAKDPNHRHGSARELRDALRRIQHQRGTTARSAEAVVRTTSPPAPSSPITPLPSEPLASARIGTEPIAVPARPDLTSDRTQPRSRPTTLPLEVVAAPAPGRRSPGRRLAVIGAGILAGITVLVGVVTIVNPNDAGEDRAREPTVVETELDPALNPVDLTVTRDATIAALTWTDASPNGAKFLIQQRADGERKWTVVGTSDEPRHTVTDLEPTKRYCYGVTAVVGATRQSEVVTTCDPAPPSPTTAR